MKRLATHCVDYLVEVGASDHRIWVLDGDLGDSYGMQRFAERFPERFLMAGIAEQNMVSVAAGMASCGARPWVFSFAAFLVYRAADQIRVSISQTKMPVALIGSHAGGCAGRNGKSHQSISDIAVIGGLPGITIWTPCDSKDVRFVVDNILKSNSPAYIRMPRDDLPCFPVTSGEVRQLAPTAPDAIVACGIATHWAMEVQELLARAGFEVSMYHVNRILPAPHVLRDVVKTARRLFIIEDHVRHGGLAEIIGRVWKRYPDLWFGWPSDWEGGSGESFALRAACGLDAHSIARAIVFELTHN